MLCGGSEVLRLHFCKYTELSFTQCGTKEKDVSSSVLPVVATAFGVVPSILPGHLCARGLSRLQRMRVSLSSVPYFLEVCIPTLHMYHVFTDMDTSVVTEEVTRCLQEVPGFGNRRGEESEGQVSAALLVRQESPLILLLFFFFLCHQPNT